MQQPQSEQPDASPTLLFLDLNCMWQMDDWKKNLGGDQTDEKAHISDLSAQVLTLHAFSPLLSSVAVE